MLKGIKPGRMVKRKGQQADNRELKQIMEYSPELCQVQEKWLQITNDHKLRPDSFSGKWRWKRRKNPRHHYVRDFCYKEDLVKSKESRI